MAKKREKKEQREETLKEPTDTIGLPVARFLIHPAEEMVIYDGPDFGKAIYRICATQASLAVNVDGREHVITAAEKATIDVAGSRITVRTSDAFATGKYQFVSR
jgi:hypothetical protein